VEEIRVELRTSCSDTMLNYQLSQNLNGWKMVNLVINHVLRHLLFIKKELVF